MPYTEAKEHSPGHLHRLFVDPYSAFDNATTERLLHLRVAMEELLGVPLRRGQLVLRVIHGWENGGCDPEDLTHADHPVGAFDELRRAEASYQQALEQLSPWPGRTGELLAAPLAHAIQAAEAQGASLDEQVRQAPSRWPSFKDGLWLYTLFKMYHRLTYGEDDPYRVSRIHQPSGESEIHEFHLEEGEFAVIRPAEATAGEHLLVLHPSQLTPVIDLLEQTESRRAAP
jgi:hypothetical protein